MKVRTLVIRSADGTALYDGYVSGRGVGTHTFTEWRAASALPFRTEVTRSIYAVAAEMVGQVFGPERSPEMGQETP
jgi:hypothetical protein